MAGIEYHLYDAASSVYSRPGIPGLSMEELRQYGMGMRGNPRFNIGVAATVEARRLEREEGHGDLGFADYNRFD
ncbi:hypothetical protein HYT52_05250 [Candidatus Woesearchaeota archaeon]|nr:hypothetical protein [Candidatus Woesearchaeota archaeon]